jgi:hypothetical protein
MIFIKWVETIENVNVCGKGIPIGHIPNEKTIPIILSLFGHEIIRDI